MKGDIADNVVYQDAGTGGDDGLQMFNPCLVFADGDAFSSVCSSANLIFNGTSISLNRQNRFWRDWMRTQVACEDASRIYKAAGGSYDKYDQRPVVVGIGAHDDNDRRPTGALNTTAVGITQDSGISERSKNLFAMSATGHGQGG